MSYFETTNCATWYCTDQQDSFLQSCISWAEQSRTPWYREFSRKHNGTTPAHIPRLNRVFLRVNDDTQWPGQADIVRIRSWVALIKSRSFEIHSDIVLVRWNAKGNPYEVPIARVQTVRVFVFPLGEESRMMLQDMLMDPPTPNDPSWMAHSDKATDKDLRVVECRTRLSEVDGMQHVNNATYPKLLMNAFWNDSNEPVKYVKRMDVEYISEVPAGIDIELAVRNSDSGDEAVRFVLLRERSTGKVLNVSRWEFNLESMGMVRYSRLRGTGRMSPEVSKHVLARINTPGPFRSEQYVGWEDTSTASAFALSMLKWSDSAFAALLCLIPMKCLVPPAELFGKLVVVMQRSIACKIFKRPMCGTVLVSESWMSKTGTSSIEFYTQFKDKNTDELCFVLKFVKVVVDLKTGKQTDRQYFDVAHFERLFKGLKTVDIPVPKTKVPAANDSSLVFTYRPLLRHQDQDTLGHVNSYVYINHVHDARDAWKAQSSVRRSVLQPIHERNKVYASDSWLDSFGIDYMGENKKGEDLCFRHYRPANPEDPHLSWFMLDDAKGRTRTRIWTRETTENDGFTPFTFEMPTKNTSHNLNSRADGINMNCYRDSIAVIHKNGSTRVTSKL